MSTIKPALKAKRHWLRFSLRTMLIAVTVLSVALGAVFYRVNQRRRNVALIEAIGGIVCYEYEELAGTPFVYVPGTIVQPESLWSKYQFAEPPGPTWLRSILGDDFFANVTYVHANSSHLTDAEFLRIRRFHHLEGLDLSGTLVTDASLAFVDAFPHLVELHLSGTHITDAGVKHLVLISNLRDLSLDDTNVTDKSIDYLKRLPHLTYLNLIDTKVTEQGIEALKKALPNCGGL